MLLPLEYSLYAKSIVGVLAIVNPMGAIPTFLSLCAGRTVEDCQKVARTSAIAVALILIIATWAGDLTLSFFGISVAAFRAGGGLLILLMAISMMHVKQSHSQRTPAEAEEANDKECIAVVPLAIPLMAGPGAISMAMINAHQLSGWYDRLILSFGIIGVALSVWVALRYVWQRQLEQSWVLPG